ncbi:AAA+-type ATPase, SpoVK/Ycf46/Vps4 family [Spirosomataceae bacterium TFI 002]|nr:AAA+-type ATPase, SpoVK/Ycf46/Vps4 family [Spirosomataceae bacterium TFI 002]
MKKDKALETLSSGRFALLLTGNVHDNVPFKSKLANRVELIKLELSNEGYSIITYSRSEGLGVYDIGKHKDVRTALQTYGLEKFLTDKKEINDQEVGLVFRNILRMLQSCDISSKIAIIVNYASHVAGHQHAQNEERVFSEIGHMLATLPILSRKGHCVIAIDDGSQEISPLIATEFHKVNYEYPSEDMYKDLFQILKNGVSDYALTNLEAEEFIKLSQGLRVTDIKSMFKDAKDKGVTIDRKCILKEKEQLINQISEQTLKVVDTTEKVEIGGMEVIQNILEQEAQLLKSGSREASRALLVTGPPGTGKTTLARQFAQMSGFNLLTLDEVKNMFVGESERRMSKALSIIESMGNCILFIDEIDQVFKSREQANMDGGVSSNHLSELFKFSSREDLRGKIIIFGASNTPHLLDPAMLSRFTIIPVIEPTPIELAKIVPLIEKQISKSNILDPNNSMILNGCETVYTKGATPRDLWKIISHAKRKTGKLNSESFLMAAKEFRSSMDPWSIALSSLVSVNMTSMLSYLPWFNSPSTYPYPWYLKDIVSSLDGTMNEELLQQRIAEAKSLAKY